jgi:1-acyl-sn-glycerol-3-phosphate acyltransferase
VVFRFIYQPYKWLLVVPLLAVSTVFFALLIMAASVFSFSRAGRFFAVSWARVNSFFTPMNVDITGYENIDPGQSYVVVANHQSLYDIYVLYGWLGIDFKWVMKKELEKVPALGEACKTLGHIFIDRSDTKSAIESINSAREKIKNGTSVLFFPEGSRSDDGKIGPFKKGAFKLAIELGIPILPITLSGTGHILPKGSLNLTPGTETMQIHRPISVDGFSEKNMKRLIVNTRSIIISGLLK